jgi:hypothetical protein
MLKDFAIAALPPCGRTSLSLPCLRAEGLRHRCCAFMLKDFAIAAVPSC